MKVRGLTHRVGKMGIAVAAACLAYGIANAAPALDGDEAPPKAVTAPPVLLFFEPGSADIPTSARPLANRALAEGVENWRRQLRIEPYVPSSSGHEATALAERRAHNVAAFLRANGVPRWRIVTSDVRTAEQLDPTFEVSAERVEIRFQSAGAPLVAGAR